MPKKTLLPLTCPLQTAPAAIKACALKEVIDATEEASQDARPRARTTSKDGWAGE